MKKLIPIWPLQVLKAKESLSKYGDGRAKNPININFDNIISVSSKKSHIYFNEEDEEQALIYYFTIIMVNDTVYYLNWHQREDFIKQVKVLNRSFDATDFTLK